jgi:hypothetical protein
MQAVSRSFQHPFSASLASRPVVSYGLTRTELWAKRQQRNLYQPGVIAYDQISEVMFPFSDFLEDHSATDFELQGRRVVRCLHIYDVHAETLCIRCEDNKANEAGRDLSRVSADSFPWAPIYI